MVNPEKLSGLVHNLRRFTGYLRELATLPETEFTSDPFKVGAAKYYLQVAIECCIDIANHIISAERLRSPRDYRDTFKVLHETGIVPDDFVPALQDMARFRNRLVHLYWEVDDRQVYHILTHDLDDFDTFVACVLDFFSPTRDKPPLHSD